MEAANKAFMQAVLALHLEGKNWLKNMHIVQRQLNSRHDTSRKMSPMQAIYRYLPRFSASLLPVPQLAFLPSSIRHAQVVENLSDAKEG